MNKKDELYLEPARGQQGDSDKDESP